MLIDLIGTDVVLTVVKDTSDRKLTIISPVPRIDKNFLQELSSQYNFTIVLRESGLTIEPQTPKKDRVQRTAKQLLRTLLNLLDYTL